MRTPVRTLTYLVSSLETMSSLPQNSTRIDRMFYTDRRSPYDEKKFAGEANPEVRRSD